MMIKKIGEEIKLCNKVAVMAHINEDGDALGSVFAMCRILKNMGKEVHAYLDAPPERRLSFLDGEYELLEEPEKVCSFDLCIALDCADKERLGERVSVFDKAKRTVCIDHHRTNTGYADINVIKPDASATGEVLYEIIRECEFFIDEYTAKCLYTAIASDSGCFKYTNTGAKTMRIAADLLEYDFDHAQVLRLLFDTETINNIRLKGYVMNNIESYADGKIQLVWTNEEILERFGVEENDAAELVNISRSVEGCEIAVELKKRKGKIRLSLRANSVDVSEIAKHFGGGGHKLAAGAEVLADSMEEAKELVVCECIRKLGELE